MLIDPTIEMNDIIDFTNTPNLDIINFTNTIDLTDLTNHTPALVDTLLGFSVDVNDPNLSLTAEQLAALTTDARFAAIDWFSHFDNNGVIDIEINIGANPSGRADGTAGVYVRDHTNAIDFMAGPIPMHHAWNVMQAGTVNEMITGVDPNGSAPDIIINIDPGYAMGSFLNPDPYASRDVPAGQLDMTTVLLHEIGHGLGFQSYRAPDTGLLPADIGPGGLNITWTESIFDSLVETHGDGTAWFTGANAVAVYGGLVPVTTLANGEQYAHFGNDLTGAGLDLMNGVALYTGTPYEISALDLAVMQDLGAPVIVPVVQVELQLVDFIGIHNSAIDAILG